MLRRAASGQKRRGYSTVGVPFFLTDISVAVPSFKIHRETFCKHTLQSQVQEAHSQWKGAKHKDQKIARQAESGHTHTDW